MIGKHHEAHIFDYTLLKYYFKILYQAIFLSLRLSVIASFCHCELSKKAWQSRDHGGHSSFVIPQFLLCHCNPSSLFVIASFRRKRGNPGIIEDILLLYSRSPLCHSRETCPRPDRGAGIYPSLLIIIFPKKKDFLNLCRI